jgi:hypothetical protein
MAGRAVGIAPAGLVAELTASEPLWRMELAAASPLWTAPLILEESELAASPVAVAASELRLATSEDMDAAAELAALLMAEVAELKRESAPEVKEFATEPPAEVADAKF